MNTPILPHWLEDKKLVREEDMDKAILRESIANGWHKGRRFRAFCAAIKLTAGPKVSLYGLDEAKDLYSGFFPDPGVQLSYRGIYEWVHLLPPMHLVRLILSNLPIRRIVPTAEHQNDEVQPVLQDLADEIIIDINEAFMAFQQPNLLYPAPEPGQIKPVSDEHVKTVMAGMQRELNRERRANDTASQLPAGQLAELPWRVQRALAERRRFRFLEWGIGEEEWKYNVFSLFKISEDPDWCVRVLMDRWGGVPSETARYMPEHLDPISREILVNTDQYGMQTYNTVIDGRVKNIYTFYPDCD